MVHVHLTKFANVMLAKYFSYIYAQNCADIIAIYIAISPLAIPNNI